MEKSLLVVTLVICLGCTSDYNSEVQTAPNTVTIEWEPTWVALFALGLDWDPRIDDWSKLNPDHFVLTDLRETKYSGQVKSVVTGRVYQCYLKKGDILMIPFYNPESLDPIIPTYHSIEDHNPS